ncbi:hypothetical protein [Nocardia sp. NPDC051570]|uniref:hypothetical protein n=1 Tax=Nocardia sp. NPDC051570 TaxID=3364324 RepID=UPI00379B9421
MRLEATPVLLGVALIGGFVTALSVGTPLTPPAPAACAPPQTTDARIVVDDDAPPETQVIVEVESERNDLAEAGDEDRTAQG